MSTHERDELLSTLNDAAPALGREATIPEYSYFWFDKKFVYAYNGGLGIRLALPTDLECGIPGKPFLDLLNTSSMKQVFLDQADDAVILQMGKSKMNISNRFTEKRVW